MREQLICSKILPRQLSIHLQSIEQNTTKDLHFNAEHNQLLLKHHIEQKK